MAQQVDLVNSENSSRSNQMMCCCVACVPNDNKKEENTDSRHNTHWQKVRGCMQAGQLEAEGPAHIEPVLEMWGSSCGLPS